MEEDLLEIYLKPRRNIRGFTIPEAIINGRIIMMTLNKGTWNTKGIEVVDEITCPGGFLFIKFGRPNKTDIRSVVENTKNISGKSSSKCCRA
jgi:hypothetical protein